MFPPEEAARFGYDRDAQAVGIVHFGIGAFHRAHQAWYTDRAMDAGDRNWAIMGVSLRSGDVANQMNPQEGLYTVTEQSGEGIHTRIVGAVKNVLVAPHEPDEVIAALAAPTTHIVSFTITEKGYCRRADGGLDPSLAGDESVYHYLSKGLRQRHDAGLPGLTLLSCDNLADNGRQLERLMREYLQIHDLALLDWFDGTCTCPCTMVDRIVPATTVEDRQVVADALDGVQDAAAVVTEPFSQWIIEDRFAGPRPRWEAVGAELVTDVHPFETAKLRMLNGAHSLLAYCGLERGYTFVHEAIGDAELRSLVGQLMLEEAAPTIAVTPEMDLRGYASELLQRFANPALNHRLSQIAMDGSQKIPQRWLATLAFHFEHGRECPAILRGISAWILHLQGHNGLVEDPLAEHLSTIVQQGQETPQLIAAIFGNDGPLSGIWTPAF